MPFQLNSQTIGLTYSQSSLSIETINDWIKTNYTDYDLVYSCVAKENHADGGAHFHVAIKLGRCFRCRDERFGDISGEHPNILRPRNFKQWVNYCKKHGEFIENGSLDNRKTRISSEEVMGAARTMAQLEFLIWAGINRVTYGRDIWRLANRDESTTIKSGDPIGGRVQPVLANINAESYWLEDKCLIIIGKSGIGKTTWAKQIVPKPCLFVSHIDDLKKFDSTTHKSILFDDVCFNHYPVQSQIHLVDSDNPRSIHVRYGTAHIPSGIRKIFTCNENPIDLDHPAIQRRCQVIRVTELNRYDTT